MEHNVHYRVRKRPPIVHILRQMDPPLQLHTLWYFSKWVIWMNPFVSEFCCDIHNRVEILLITGRNSKSGGSLFMLTATAFSKHFKLRFYLEKGSCIINLRTSLGVLTGTHLTCQMCFALPLTKCISQTHTDNFSCQHYLICDNWMSRTIRMKHCEQHMWKVCGRKFWRLEDTIAMLVPCDSRLVCSTAANSKQTKRGYKELG